MSEDEKKDAREGVLGSPDDVSSVAPAEAEKTVPFHEVFPGLKEGEVPEGPEGAFNKEQVMRMLAHRARAARAALGLVDDSCILSVPAGDIQGMDVAKNTVAADGPSRAATAAAVELPVTPSAQGPVPATPTPDLQAAGVRLGSEKIRVEMPGGRFVETTVEEQAERQRFSEGINEFWKKRYAEADAKYGPSKDSGWDIPPPPKEKLARLLNLHNPLGNKNLCATCKHAVQMVQPLSDLGGFGYHEIRTFCELIRVEGGMNLEIEDRPTQYCSHHSLSVSRVLKRKWIQVQANGKPAGRFVRALRVLTGKEEMTHG